MALNNVIKEEMTGLASIFDIKCHLCGKINKIKTSSEHRSGKRGRLTYDINTRAVLGSLHAGIGNTRLNNLFSTMNIPTMNNRTFKSREREVECAVEVLAQASCKKNMEVEKKIPVDVCLPNELGSSIACRERERSWCFRQ